MLRGKFIYKYRPIEDMLKDKVLVRAYKQFLIANEKSIKEEITMGYINARTIEERKRKGRYLTDEEKSKLNPIILKEFEEKGILRDKDNRGVDTVYYFCVECENMLGSEPTYNDKGQVCCSDCTYELDLRKNGDKIKERMESVSDFGKELVEDTLPHSSIMDGGIKKRRITLHADGSKTDNTMKPPKFKYDTNNGTVETTKPKPYAEVKVTIDYSLPFTLSKSMDDVDDNDNITNDIKLEIGGIPFTNKKTNESVLDFLEGWIAYQRYLDKISKV